MSKILILLLAYLACTLAVYGNKGACKTGNYTDVNVDWNRYLGKWYNVAVSKSFLFSEPSDQCTIANYSLNTDGTVKVDNEAIKKTGKLSKAIGTAKIVGPGQLKVSFSKLQPFGGNYEVIYVDNDYSIATVVGCNGLGFLGFSDVWILARDYNVSQEQINSALQAASNQGFDISDVNLAGIAACDRL
ncbi:lipocalin/cytosolic fatty-acid-binding family protein (macronuclear) [Tetrahymena thermophila SB210]|uniref:Lipocalin/cytosolic fatty-acid-binding family protein n=1 Tax=Tetrahymena thermophila (strain SB210) TaxID=312017 RepID=Q22EG0_TETTS|nr:lipocalin/cytosolic fatty-acid-binding family protein [Tetrahymena thermophila SB210]EAR83692.1 lipocalin/cytosolic fatty-acid-binding family protein [Tetrahymena thermophila SB210]|eukprot:XP_001031355.1 lipocalin/cytosolic fatty-acid-binding family protein [Tetrahymena thermophila SB210]